MTPTAEDLTNSSAFWKRRMEEQMDYIRDFYDHKRTRPDKRDVLDSAFVVFERCQFFYLSAYIMEEIGGILDYPNIQRIFLDHVACWNSTSERSKVVAFDKKFSNKGTIFTYVESTTQK